MKSQDSGLTTGLGLCGVSEGLGRLGRRARYLVVFGKGPVADKLLAHCVQLRPLVPHPGSQYDCTRKSVRGFHPEPGISTGFRPMVQTDPPHQYTAFVPGTNRPPNQHSGCCAWYKPTRTSVRAPGTSLRRTRFFRYPSSPADVR
eukprot:2256124-Rhodomonas_salina.2